MALLHLARDWVGDRPLRVASVNHNLRAGALAECAMVAQVCARLGLPHDQLDWTGWDGRGNLQDAAREARLTLLAGWAKAHGLGAVALGHTRDDQAETLLLRLARGSGVEGLSAMAARDTHHGAIWLRPLLGMSRDSLREYLRGRGVAWIDDPSNDNPAFDRVKARHALAHLSELGLDAQRLTDTATRLRAARDSLDWAARMAARDVVRLDRGDVVFDAAKLDALPADLGQRLVAAALCHISSQTYRPRHAALIRAMSEQRATLHGCVLQRAKGVLRITREYQSVADHAVPLGQIWDHRWHITAPDPVPQNAEIRALGPDGLALCADWRATGLPRWSLTASPSVWAEGKLLAAPLAGFGPDYRASVNFLRQDFFSDHAAH